MVILYAIGTLALAGRLAWKLTGMWDAVAAVRAVRRRG